MGSENKDKEKEGVKQSPWSLLAMLPGIAGDAAKIFSSPEEDSLREMQRGGGVGSRAIAAAQQSASRDQLSAQAVGHGATRGLGILAASDRGNEAMERMMPALGMTAAREQALATEQLRQNRAAQIGSAANLGWKLTGGIGGAIANMVAAKDQGEAGEAGADSALLGQQGMDRETGLTPGATTPFETTGEQTPGMEQAPGAISEMAQRGEILPGAGVSPLPVVDDYLFPGQGEQEALMRDEAGMGSQTKSPVDSGVDAERGAEQRRKMNKAQLGAAEETYKATSRASEPYPDAPLGTAILSQDPAASPLDDAGISEWIWGKYRDGEAELTEVQDVLRMYNLPMEPPEWFQWAPGVQ